MTDKAEDWIEFDGPVHKFVDNADNKRPAVLEIVKKGSTDFIVVGHINLRGGSCNCCELFDDDETILKRYKLLRLPDENKS